MLRDISPHQSAGVMVDTPPSSPGGSLKEVSSIQVSVTYTDGSTEVRGFRSKSPPRGMAAPMSPPTSEADKDEEMAEPKEEVLGAIFEPQEIQNFPQASGYCNAESIWVVTKNTDRETLVIPPVQDEPLCLKVNSQNTAKTMPAEPLPNEALNANHLVKLDDGAVISAKLTPSACQGHDQVFPASQLLWQTQPLKTFKKFAPIAPRPSLTPSKMPPTIPTKAADKRERSFVCTYENCGKTYLKSSHLKAHIRVHTGTTKFARAAHPTLNQSRFLIILQVNAPTNVQWTVVKKDLPALTNCLVIAVCTLVKRNLLVPFVAVVSYDLIT